MRATPRARRLGTAALVLTIGAGLASCSDDAGSADSPSSATDEDGTKVGSEAPVGTSVGELSVDDFYPSVMAALREAGTFTFETVSESAGQSQTMSGRARFTDTGMELTASSTGARAMEMIWLGQAMYLKSPDLGGGDAWVRIDLSDPDSLFGRIGSAADPEAMFKAMQSPEKLEVLGTEDVDGVGTHHYRITMDASRYVEAMGLPAAMAGMLPKELVTEMWVDGDNLPRKFVQATDGPAAGGAAASPSTTEGTYSDFGADVRIEAPPADEVTEDFPGA